SLPWVAGASVLMLLAYVVPIAALLTSGASRWLGLAAWALLSMIYLPTLCYYRRNPLIAPLLPAVAFLYLGITWLAALRGLTGTRSTWKGRRYEANVRKEESMNDHAAVNTLRQHWTPACPLASTTVSLPENAA